MTPLKVNTDEKFYYFQIEAGTFNCRVFDMRKDSNYFQSFIDECKASGNYFESRTEAMVIGSEVSDKIKEIIKEK